MDVARPQHLKIGQRASSNQIDSMDSYWVRFYSIFGSGIALSSLLCQEHEEGFDVGSAVDACKIKFGGHKMAR